MKYSVLFALALGLSVPLFAQTIDEKRNQLQGGSAPIEQSLDRPLAEFNAAYDKLLEDVRMLRKEAERLRGDDANDARLHDIAMEIRSLRAKMREEMEMWRELAATQNETENYALWHQPNVTIEQLITDYGSLDFVYLMADDIAQSTINLSSNLPIPRTAWEEMLDLILAEAGIGIHEPNAFLRVLYRSDEAQHNLALITDDRAELDSMPDSARVGFWLTVPPQETKRTFNTLTRLTQPEFASFHLLADSILIVGPSPTVREILKLNDFIGKRQGNRSYRLYPLRRGNPEEMAQLLTVIFAQELEQPEIRVPAPGQSSTSNTTSSPPSNTAARASETGAGLYDAGFVVMPLTNLTSTLFLIGSPAQLDRSIEILEDLQEQIGEEQEKQIFWYTCKHSTAEDLAVVLDQVYRAMQGQNIEGNVLAQGQMPPGQQQQQQQQQQPGQRPPSSPNDLYRDGISITVNPTQVDPSREREPDSLSQRDNFIVDPKTGSIIMVLDPVSLQRIQDLIRKLDVPKKMVRIEVVVFEKQFNDRTEYGLENLVVGKSNNVNSDGAVQDTGATNVNDNRTIFNGRGDLSGVLQFILRTTGGNGWPAADVGYRFLLSQDDITINASPTITTINQTKATISIVEERSISTGRQIQNVSGDNVNTESFARAQYGIVIEITPTIHSQAADEYWDDFEDYVTMETLINFDTVPPSQQTSNQPNVGRRNLTNLVRIPDGETIVIGGLRRRDAADTSARIPLVGEIPGLGKLFSYTGIADVTVETFIMITPTIINDPTTEMEKLKRRELMRRPGDLPEFLHKLRIAEEKERKALFRQTAQILFGRQLALSRPMEEYDGRE